jgi:hypothetical protein
MPWLQYVVTKRATSASTVELRNVAEVHAEMRAKAAAAVRALASAKTMRANEPVRAALKVVRPASLAMLRGVPGVALSADGDEVTFEANDFQGAYDGLNALIGVARLALSHHHQRGGARTRDSTLIARPREFDGALVRRESERWHPLCSHGAHPRRKYYGAQ